MKKCFLLGLFIFLINSLLVAQPSVKLRTGVIYNNTPLKNPSNSATTFSNCLYNNKYYIWLQFYQIPSEENKKLLQATGVQIYSYLPDKTFIASFPKGYNYRLLKSFKVYAVTKPVANCKIDIPLVSGSGIPWAVEQDSLRIVNITFIPIVSKVQMANILTAAGIVFTNMPNNDGDELVLKASIAQLRKIANHPLIHFIEATTATPVLEDIQGTSNHRSSMMATSDNWTTGRKLDGDGVTIVLGDDGFIGPHIDFTGRIQTNATNTSTANTHGDHCAGIITSAGNLNPLVRGQAPAATLLAYDYYADFNNLPSLYTTFGARITTHSLGQTCNAGYTTDARTSDIQMRTYPSLMHVHSAGNSGTSTCGGLTGGWASITGGYKSGKNVIAVANLTKSDVISSSSSKGPLPDGRIKPDIAAVGSSVNSTQPNNTYTLLSGTSMASPAIAGVLGVMYQAYKKKNAGIDPNSGLMKAILMNAADDLGNAGPDFTYGFGRVNTRRSVECIENQMHLSGSISQGLTNTHSIVIPNGVAKTKIMVYWVDVPATAGANPSLVNNLDSWAVSPELAITNPWVLYAGLIPTNASCSALAFKGIDTLNNVEQIEIDNPIAGNYQIKVKGSNVPFGPQDYFVVYEFYYANNIVVTYPFGGESFAPNEVQRLRWDATENTGTFTAEYSMNNGFSWATIATGISGSQRYYDWTLPNTNSGQARVRISRGVGADISDTTFVVVGVPIINSITPVCAGTSNVSWSSVAGANGYDVFKLGTKFMELAASTTNNNVNIDNLGNGINWIAVRAKMGVRQYGRKSNATSHTNAAINTCSLPLQLIYFNAVKKGANAELIWQTAQEQGIIKFQVERSSTATFDNFITVAEASAKNMASIQNYTVTDKNTGSKGTWYYRLKIIERDRNTYSNIQNLKWDATIQAIYLYPNPTSTTISILSQQDFGMVNAHLINAVGAKVADWKLNLKAGVAVMADVSKFAQGNYFLVIYSPKSNELLAQQKLTIIK